MPYAILFYMFILFIFGAIICNFKTSFDSFILAMCSLACFVEALGAFNSLLLFSALLVTSSFELDIYVSELCIIN
jgi:hypothetical protein